MANGRFPGSDGESGEVIGSAHVCNLEWWGKWVGNLMCLCVKLRVAVKLCG